MDAHRVQLLEGLFHKKIILSNDLLHCLKKERESLINIDLDSLWSISKEKEEICSKIESIREDIVSTLDSKIDHGFLDSHQILELLPEEHKAAFQKLFQTLLRLKGEIEVIRKENMIFIDDSLQFLDEMMSILTGKTKSKILYDEKCHWSRSGANVLLSREA
ncbi:MAG: flagellar export chaperone FlgN [Deltaproteobacteria bacterium]|nr:flagellar export chaperone FlgN [Deltaproteobacteria bacterium]